MEGKKNSIEQREVRTASYTNLFVESGIIS